MIGREKILRLTLCIQLFIVHLKAESAVQQAKAGCDRHMLKLQPAFQRPALERAMHIFHARKEMGVVMVVVVMAMIVIMVVVVVVCVVVAVIMPMVMIVVMIVPVVIVMIMVVFMIMRVRQAALLVAIAGSAGPEADGLDGALTQVELTLCEPFELLHVDIGFQLGLFPAGNAIA